MRLDKYLKVARIIKRRTIAKEAATKDRVQINGLVAKPSKTVEIGDVLTLRLGQKTTTLKVTSLKPIKDQLMYELIEEKRKP